MGIHEGSIATDNMRAEQNRVIPEEMSMLSDLIEVSSKMLNDLENRLAYVLQPQRTEAEGGEKGSESSMNSPLSNQVQALRRCILSQHRQIHDMATRVEV